MGEKKMYVPAHLWIQCPFREVVGKSWKSGMTSGGEKPSS